MRIRFSTRLLVTQLTLTLSSIAVFGPGFSLAVAASLPKSELRSAAGLIEEAKKEGKLVFWGSDQVNIINPVLDVFRKRYPFLQTEYWRAGSDKIALKAIVEARAGRYGFDFASVDNYSYPEVRRFGLMRKYNWPNAKHWDAEYKDPDGYAVVRNILQTVIAYNTRLVRAAEAPKNWDEVLDPKWKGAISLDKEGGEWVLMLWTAWGKEKAISYLKTLSKNEPQLGQGSTARIEMLAAGAFKIDLRLNLNHIRDFQNHGAPVEWVRASPILESATFMYIAERAPHPHAAMLFADWLTSHEGQKVYSDSKGQISPDPTIKGRSAEMAEALQGLNRVFVPLQTSKYANEADQIFRDIFFR